MSNIENEKLYNIRNIATQKMLNLYAGRTADGTNVCMWEGDNSTEQKWRPSIDNPNGLQVLYTAVDSSKVLDFYSGNTNFANADIWTDNDANNQAIHIIQLSATQCKIELLSRPNYVLTAKGAADNSDVRWELDVNSEFQKWNFEPMPTNSVEGLDTAAQCSSGTANAIAAHPNGYNFVCRYYCANHSSSKILTLPEAELLSAKSLHIVSVYQDANNLPEHFNYAIGQSDAQNAISYALNVTAQPVGSAIYFAVDFNPAATVIDRNIASYFDGIRGIFGNYDNIYKIGVYGSGLVCQTIKQDLQLADYSWLAQSTAYYGTAAYNSPSKYDIRQGCHVTIDGVLFDSNASGLEPDFGQWQI